MPKNIKEFWVDSLPSGGAAVSVTDGRNINEIYYNRSVLRDVPPQIFRFIRNHEIAHLVLDTDDEFVADAWGFYKSMQEGGSTHDAIKAITRILDFDKRDTKMNWARFKAQEQRAVFYEKITK